MKLKAKSADPYNDPTSIGNLAIEKGYATLEQVAKAIRKQEERQPLGKILVDQGVLTELQLAELLIDQETRRRHLTPAQTRDLWRIEKRSKFQEVAGAFHGLSDSLRVVAKS
jgi:hypothetical protein